MRSDDSNQFFDEEDKITFSDLDPRDEQQTRLDKLFKPFGLKFVAYPAEEEEEDDCEFDLRMSDVPDEVLDAYKEPDIFEVKIANLGKYIWTYTPHKRLLASSLLFALVAIFVAISSFSHATLSLLPLFSSKLPVNQSLSVNDSSLAITLSHDEENYLAYGPNASVMVTPRTVPNYCVTGTVLGQGRQIGNFPVWAIGIGNDATVHLPSLILQNIKDWKGWVVPMRVRGRYNYLNNISLTIFNFNNTSSPLLQDRYTPIAAMHLFLDTKHVTSVTGTGMRAIATWDISLYIPNAGCYGLIASWGTGNWTITFAAGQ